VGSAYMALRRRQEFPAAVELFTGRQPESSVRVEGEKRSYVNVSESTRRRWPPHGWLGLALVGAFWTLNWSLAGLRTRAAASRCEFRVDWGPVSEYALVLLYSATLR